MSEPDLTVKQAVDKTKAVAAEAPVVSDEIERSVHRIVGIIQAAYPNTPLAVTALRLSDDLAKGLVTANDAAIGVTKLLGQFGLPIALAGGVRLQGSGAVAGAVTTAQGKLMEGVRFALTNRQKIVTEVSGWLTLIATVGGAILAIYPQFGAQALGGGVTIGLAIQGLKNVIIPRLNQYADAPKT